MENIETEMSKAKSRISKIDFLKPVSIKYATDILPSIQEKIDKNRDLLYKLRQKVRVTRRLKDAPRGHVLKKIQGQQDEKFHYITLDELHYPFSEMKREFYKREGKDAYKIFAKTSRECFKIARRKIGLAIHEIMKDASIHGVGGSIIYCNSIGIRHHIYEIKNVIAKDISAYMWNEAVRDKEENPYEILLQFYELQVIPFGLESTPFTDENGDYRSTPEKFIIEIPLDKNQVKSNIAKGQYILQREAMWDGVYQPRDRNLLRIIKEYRRDTDCVVLTRPEIVDHYTLVTYVDGDNGLKHVRYWNEIMSRPLFIS